MRREVRFRFRSDGRLRGGLACVALWVALGGPATAVPVAFTGTLSLEIFGQTPIAIAGSGVAEVVSVGGAVVQLTLPAGVFNATATIQAPAELTPIVQLAFAVSNAAIVLSASQLPCNVADPAVACVGSGPLHGRSGLEGQLIAGLLGSFGSPLTTLALVATPIGGAGSFLGTNTLLAIGVRLIGAGWTTGTGAAFSTQGGQAVGTLVAMGSATGGPTGSLQMVTPFAIRSDFGGATVAGMARIRIDFVPEPATGPLFLMGFAALVLGARRQRRWHA